MCVIYIGGTLTTSIYLSVSKLLKYVYLYIYNKSAKLDVIKLYVKHRWYYSKVSIY